MLRMPGKANRPSSQEAGEFEQKEAKTNQELMRPTLAAERDFCGLIATNPPRKLRSHLEQELAPRFTGRPNRKVTRGPLRGAPVLSALLTIGAKSPDCSRPHAQ
jgi:hypothetical protein